MVMIQPLLMRPGKWNVNLNTARKAYLVLTVSLLICSQSVVHLSTNSYKTCLFYFLLVDCLMTAAYLMTRMRNVDQNVALSEPYHPIIDFGLTKRKQGKQSRSCKSSWFKDHDWLTFCVPRKSLFYSSKLCACFTMCLTLFMLSELLLCLLLVVEAPHCEGDFSFLAESEQPL